MTVGSNNSLRRSVALLASMRRNPSTLHAEVSEVFSVIESDDSYRRTMLTRAIQVLEALAFRGVLERTALIEAYKTAAAEHAGKLNSASLRRWFEAGSDRSAFINPADADESLLKNGYMREAIGVFELCVDLASLIQDELHAA